MPRSKKPSVPILRVRKGATEKEINAKARRAFTAADLQKYTEIEEGIPARQILAKLVALDRQAARAKRRKLRDGRSG